MGIALATMGVFAPTRKRTLVKIAPRALIAANMVSLMTASIAGSNTEKTSFLYCHIFIFRSTLRRARYTSTEFYTRIKDYLFLTRSFT